MLSLSDVRYLNDNRYDYISVVETDNCIQKSFRTLEKGLDKVIELLRLDCIEKGLRYEESHNLYIWPRDRFYIINALPKCIGDVETRVDVTCTMYQGEYSFVCERSFRVFAIPKK